MSISPNDDFALDYWPLGYATFYHALGNPIGATLLLMEYLVTESRARQDGMGGAGPSEYLVT